MKLELSQLEKSWPTFDKIITEALKQNIKVLEIGAGSNPYLTKKIISTYNLDYYIQDIDIVELRKAEGAYFTIINSDVDKIIGNYDLIFSKMVLEHISDSNSFHKHINRLLSSTGTCIHFFATLYNIASITNLILPERLSRYLLLAIAKRDTHQHDKFPAFYKKCFGPTSRNVHYFQNLGYTIQEYHGFVGHNYFWNYKAIYFFEKAWSKILLKWKNPYTCSNSILILRKVNNGKN